MNTVHLNYWLSKILVLLYETIPKSLLLDTIANVLERSVINYLPKFGQFGEKFGQFKLLDTQVVLLSFLHILMKNVPVNTLRERSQRMVSTNRRK